MVTFWRSWAHNLTEKDTKEIKRISYDFAWLNFNKDLGTYSGTFYYFPKGSGYKDSPPVPEELKAKTELLTLARGWIKDKTFTPLETVAEMFPENLDKLYEKLEAKISKEHVK